MRTEWLSDVLDTRDLTIERVTPFIRFAKWHYSDNCLYTHGYGDTIIFRKNGIEFEWGSRVDEEGQTWGSGLYTR